MADNSVGGMLNSMIAVQVQSVMSRAAGTPESAAAATPFVDRLMQQLGRQSAETPSDSAPIETVDALWQRMKLLSMAGGNGQADAIMQALNDRDEAARTHKTRSLFDF